MNEVSDEETHEESDAILVRRDVRMMTSRRAGASYESRTRPRQAGCRLKRAPSGADLPS
jgi:hypothetical protein